MRKYLVSVYLAVLIPMIITAQENNLKREFRAAWVASVANLDWPTRVGLSSEEQKQQLINIYEDLKEVNMNAVVLQIRPECDALYDSPYDPWSYWLTGQQGKAPDPYYDPLEFAVEEAHKRGIELHAWFNPYRVTRSVSGTYPQDEKHVSNQHPEWVLQVSNLEFLDPGIPMVRKYVTDVVMDVVNRYDIDGIHFDDYFYPYEGITNQDNESWNLYRGDFTNKDDWRRNNVNELLRMINDSLQVVEPFVKFGMSPFGIWKSGVPSGISGLSGYSAIYCDAIAWLQERSIDYLTPQCYWQIGGAQDYIRLTNWWADSVSANERHLYPGQALYRQENWDANEIPRQIRHNRDNPNIQGSVLFRALNLRDNPKGVTDSLIIDLNKNIALTPVMEWKDLTPPNPPSNLRLERIAGTATTGLVWDKSEVPEDDPGRFFTIYSFNSENAGEEQIADPANIVELIGETSYVPQSSAANEGPFYFAVSALDRNSNESTLSNLTELTSPSTPLLAAPADDAVNQYDSTLLTWSYTAGAGEYSIQVSVDSNFTDNIIEESGITDSTYLVTGMTGQQTYYWRVKSGNIAGESDYSAAWSFTTGFPLATSLIYPTNETTDIIEKPEFKWNSVEGAEHYRLQVVRSILSWSEELIILDVDNIMDTVYTDEEVLQLGEFYSWRVMAANEFGYSEPSQIFKFQVNTISAVESENSELPVEYSLYQNYPNPFNPSTRIMFDLPESGFTTLRVYNLLGQEIAVLVQEQLNAGKYSVTFEAASFGRQLPSGIYIYRLNSGNKLFTRKMMLVK